jgi:hypothetical protein
MTTTARNGRPSISNLPLGRFATEFLSRKTLPFQQTRRVIANVLQDLSFAFRLLRKSPGITLAAVLSLGIGIGLNVAIYGIVHAVLLSELPYPDPDRLVAVSEAIGTAVWPTSYPNYLDWKAEAHSTSSRGLTLFFGPRVSYLRLPPPPGAPARNPPALPRKLLR